MQYTLNPHLQATKDEEKTNFQPKIAFLLRLFIFNSFVSEFTLKF